MRMLNNKEESEDVLQESFISAFKKINQHKESSGFGSWLKKIVINKCIDNLYKRKQIFIELKEEILPAEEFDDEEEINFSVEEVMNAITGLPDGYRLILTLYLIENYSHKMIAEKLGISEGTSKSQYSRARKKLGESMLKKRVRHGG